MCRRLSGVLLAGAVVFIVGVPVAAQPVDLGVGSPGLSPETSAACPTGCKLEIDFTPGSDSSFLVSAESIGETVFRAVFWIDPNSLDMPTAPRKTARFIEFRKGPPNRRLLLFGSLYIKNGTYRIDFLAEPDDDTASRIPVAGFVVPDGVSRFVVEWQAASDAGETDGLVRVTRGNNVKEVTDYDYYFGGSGVDSVNFGLARNSDSGIDGEFYLDTYSSFRTLAPIE